MGLWRPSTGTKGLDRSLTIADALEALVADGFRFAIRTLPLPDVSVGTLTQAEVDAIHDAGLGLAGYQVIRRHGFSADQGKKDGAFAARRARELGFPDSCVLWFDLEGEQEVDAATLVAFINGWSDAVVDAGFAAGLYNGPQRVLGGQQISDLPKFHAYWQSGSAVPPVRRGYQIYQLLPAEIIVGGINIDVNVVQSDFRGDRPSFWKRDEGIA